MAIVNLTLLVTLVLANLIQRSSATDWDSDDSAGFQGQEEAVSSTFALEASIERAHGIIGTVTFALLFPLGGILIRLLPGRLSVYLHAAWQLMALCLGIVTLGMGVWLAKGTAYIETYHAIIGIVAVVGVCMQPVTGWLHHRNFRRVGKRGATSYVHVYFGIGVVTLGTINGGFGLQLAHAERKYVIIYAVLAALVWVVWMGVSVVSQCFGGFRRRLTGHKRTKGMGSDGDGKPSADVRETSMP